MVLGVGAEVQVAPLPGLKNQVDFAHLLPQLTFNYFLLNGTVSTRRVENAPLQTLVVRALF